MVLHSIAYDDVPVFFYDVGDSTQYLYTDDSVGSSQDDVRDDDSLDDSRDDDAWDDARDDDALDDARDDDARGDVKDFYDDDVP